MEIVISKKMKLKRPPTSICQFQNRTYIATKGKRVFYTSDFKNSKSIVFSSQVNAVCASEEFLFAGQEDGKVFALNTKHKTMLNLPVGDSRCIDMQINKATSDLYVGLEEKKICQYSNSGILKNSVYSNEERLTCFDVEENGTVARCFQNDVNTQLVNKKEKISIKTTDGYPEVIKFVQDSAVLVGSTTGVLSLFSVSTKKRMAYVKLDKQITAIHVLSDTRFLVGIEDEIVLIEANFNCFKILSRIAVEGIPVNFTGTFPIVCAVSRESRIGRFMRNKTGCNQVLEIEIK